MEQEGVQEQLIWWLGQQTNPFCCTSSYHVALCNYAESSAEQNGEVQEEEEQEELPE